MSTYDYLSGNQIKLFYNPVLIFPEKEMPLENSIYWCSGSLKNYKKNEKIPFQSFHYNYKKEFNIIDFFPNEKEEKILIHRIRDGKFISSTINLKKEDFYYSFFNIYGEELNIDCKKDIESFKNIDMFIKDIILNSPNMHFKNFINFLKENINDYSVDYEKKKKQLEFLYFKELKENEHIIEPYKTLKQSFIKQSKIKDEHTYYGALIKTLLSQNFHNCLDNNYEFLINDERLLFIHGYNEFKNIQKHIQEFDYFDNLDFTETMINEYKENLIEIEKLYKKISSLKLKKEQFNINYALKKIETYKEYYLKYNVIPYESFDTWN